MKITISIAYDVSGFETLISPH